MALQRPLWLLHRRMELREQLEMKRDHLRRVKSWNEVIPTQRRQIEQAKESVVEVSPKLFEHDSILEWRLNLLNWYLDRRSAISREQAVKSPNHIK